MEAMRQSCRPKHQVLVLKCYPKFQKNAVDVKPNPSELSYLLYYASTRRSKLSKVGAFLEKRTAQDVRHGRSWDVQITLRILKALMDKAPRDLPLFAASVLNVLATVLRAGDLTTAEESVPTFESLCSHHDGPALAASQDHRGPFRAVLGAYADLTRERAVPAKAKLSTPVALRWRAVGLRAVGSAATSAAVGLDEVGYLDLVMPVVLDQLRLDGGGGDLRVLHRRACSEDQTEDERPMARRWSLATVRTSEAAEPHATAFVPTAADADRAAQERIGLMALQSLRGIFTTSNRDQIRAAATLLLGYIASAVPRREASGAVPRLESWAAALLEMVARWVPVQDRYIILMSATEALGRLPRASAVATAAAAAADDDDDDLRRQLLLASAIGSLLRSDVNLIGLGVIDILVDLLRHILAVLELEPPTPVAASPEGTARGGRDRLLHRLRSCIGDLSTHVYYADQIADMITTVLVRLRPSPAGAPNAIAILGEDRPVDEHMGPAPGSPHPKVKPAELFWTGPARVVALEAIADILRVANETRTLPRQGQSSRNRVGIEVWEGTHWLLRDRDGHVRRAYVEALSAWLRSEVDRGSVRALLEAPRAATVTDQPDRALAGTTGPAQGARAGVPRRHPLRPARPRFLPLLHVSIYDDVMERAASASEMMLMHWLLTRLTETLGAAAVRHGLPMVFRLQDELPKADGAPTRVGMASLVHGYLWTLSEQFGSDASWVARDLQHEIGRRKNLGAWMEAIQVPPIKLELIRTPDGDPAHEWSRPGHERIDAGLFRPFEHRTALIDLVDHAFAASLASPPGSPSSSPSRKLILPILDSTPASAPAPHPTGALPRETRAEMASEWNRDAILASCQAENTRSLSGSGSRNGFARKLSGGRDLYGVAGVDGGVGGNIAVRNASGDHHPRHSRHPVDRPRSPVPPPARAIGASLAPNGIGPLPRARQLSLRGTGGMSTPLSASSSRSSVLRVDELKRVLSGSTTFGVASAVTSRGSRREAPLSTEHAGRGGSRSSIGEEDAVLPDGQGASGRSAMPGVAATDFARPTPGPIPALPRSPDDHSLRWGHYADDLGWSKDGGHGRGRRSLSAPGAGRADRTTTPVTAAPADERSGRVRHMKDPSTASTIIPRIPDLPPSVLSTSHSSSSTSSLPLQGIPSTSHPNHARRHGSTHHHRRPDDAHEKHDHQTNSRYNYGTSSDDALDRDFGAGSEGGQDDEVLLRPNRTGTASSRPRSGTMNSGTEDLGHLLDLIRRPPTTGQPGSAAGVDETGFARHRDDLGSIGSGPSTEAGGSPGASFPQLVGSGLRSPPY